MRVLFDKATPVPIRTFLIGHTVRTAAQEHWDTLQNGDLLTVAEHAGFEVFLTTDKNMRYQQNMAGRTIAVVVIGLQQWPALRPQSRLSRPQGTPRPLARIAPHKSRRDSLCTRRPSEASSPFSARWELVVLARCQ